VGVRGEAKSERKHNRGRDHINLYRILANHGEKGSSRFRNYGKMEVPKAVANALYMKSRYT